MGRLAPLALAALVLAAPGTAAAGDLYQWIDRSGVVRYTPDPQNVPSDRKSTLVRVEPGMDMPETLLSPSRGGPSLIYAPPGEGPYEADPFAAPGQARTPEPGEAPQSMTPMSEAARENQSRSAMLRARIAQDEERLKDLISEEHEDGSDPLVQSEEIRDIARRLPLLQAELRALEARRARQEPR